jgi:exodeoxyribonuclease V beta subunit
MTARRLDPLRLPLRGHRLIEASAGTGKTYTLVTLYLRLLLEADLDVANILVVTFTNAATEELRGRIRRRIAEAIDALDTPGAADAPLAAILDGLPDRSAARRHLADILTRLDEAAVYTIHGFCQRTLRENAFESRVAFEAEFVTDESELRRTVIADFWRRQSEFMDILEARWLRCQWRTPADLLKALGPLVRDGRIQILPDPAALTQTGDFTNLAEGFEALKADWHVHREEVLHLLLNSPGLNRRSYTKPVVQRAVAAMDEMLSGDLPMALPSELGRFTPALLKAQTKAGDPPPTHAFFHRWAAFAETFDVTLKARRVTLLAAARDFLAGETVRRKRQRQVLSFDDLLRLVDEALTGAGGPALASAIRERYPAALIDEFQDTDPLQYRIFQRIYHQRDESGLFLIGDPKQAIYSFRGADIFTYMQAKNDAGAQRTYTLGTNWRSATRLVAAVNHLFSTAQRPFVYDRHIPFLPVDAGPRADDRPLKLDGKVPTPLCFWFLETHGRASTRNGAITADAAREAAAAVCAGQIAGLLTLSSRGGAVLGDAPLQAGDIAVLVRSHNDGLWMQRALRARGIASVSLSQESVFDTLEAEALQQVLMGVSDPGNEGRFKGALASALLEWPAAEILALDDQAQRREAVLDRFHAYRDLWLHRGFQRAFFALIEGEAILERLQADPDGERRLTNLLHLGELLQAASRQFTGPERLLRWLADQRCGLGADDERLLRLESDEALVQIVTIHKSKGLEYPVVFVPFPWAGGTANREPVVFHAPDPPYPVYLDLGSHHLEAHQALAAAEDLAERLRLLYVAVTRARHLCVLTWGRINNADHSALAWLLHPYPGQDPPRSLMKDLTEDEIRARLEALADGATGAIQVKTAAEGPAPEIETPAEGWKAFAARQFTGRITGDWRLTSYSGLLAGMDVERPDHDPEPSAETTDAPSAPVDAVFRFPRGTVAGQCLHELLETIDFPVAEGPALAEAIQRQLARYAIDDVWQPAAAEIVRRTLDTALDADGLHLRAIGRPDRLDEMEFHFPLARLEPSRLAGVLADFAGYRSAGQGLHFDPVQGLMKGFIDVVFRHHGRYYIVDYKSNHLGDHLQDYGPGPIRDAMAAHRYDLQYLVYTVALHRYLAHRLPGYRYHRHFGGVYYLFLRGMHPDHGPSQGVFFRRPEPALVEALDRMFAGKTDSRGLP